MKNLVILLSFIILLSNITLAASPFISANQGGCQITPIVREYLKTNVSFDFNFHVFNFTNGVPLSNTTLDCVFHFYNQTGDHVFSTKLKNDPFSEHEIINEWAERMDGGNISTNGNYAYIVQCNGTNTGCSDKGSFIVTSNGFPLPSEFVIVFFSIIYIISGFGIAFVILYSIGHLLKLDFDLKDFALNLGTYFAIIMIYYLQSYYMGNVKLDDWFLMILTIGGTIFVLLPIISLILSMTIGSLNKKKINAGTPPRKMYRV